MKNVYERRFRFNNEEEWEEVKKLLGVIEGQFQILRREMRLRELEYAMRIAKTCVIIQNLTDCMQQNGNFCDEADGVNLSTELLETDD